MKFFRKHYADGEIRQRSGFLWFPKSVFLPDKLVTETRWLSVENWEERWRNSDEWSFGGWETTKFIDGKE